MYTKHLFFIQLYKGDFIILKIFIQSLMIIISDIYQQ